MYILAMQLALRMALFALLAVAGLTAAEDEAAALDLQRTRALVEAGALPRQALEKAEGEIERRALESRLRDLTAKSELTSDELPEMIQASAKLLQMARAELSAARSRVIAGASPAKELEPLRDAVLLAERRDDLIGERVRLVRQLHQMASAEERLDELEEEELAFQSPGDGGYWEDDLEWVMSLYFDEFGRDMPISANGSTEFHRSMGLDHTGRVDVALHPDDLEGFYLIELLESFGIPYIAFRSAVPGQATGPHIHIGLPSPRLAVN